MVKRIVLPFFAAAAFFLFRCALIGPSEENAAGSVAPILVFSAPETQTPGAAKASASELVIPAMIESRAVKVIGVLKHSSGVENRDVNFSDRHLRFENIPPGGAQLDITVRDKVNAVLLTGSQNFQVEPGITVTPVVGVSFAAAPAPTPIVTQECRTRVLVHWPYAGGTVLEYHLERKLGGGGLWQQIFQILQINPDSVNAFDYRDSMVVPGNTYFYRLVAVWQSGGAPNPVSQEASIVINQSVQPCPCGGNMTGFNAAAPVGYFCIDKLRDANTNIAYLAARDACANQGKRLCNPGQWVVACNNNISGGDNGPIDLSGAVTEWVADDDLNPTTPVYEYNTQPGTCAANNAVQPTNRGAQPNRGFRCCR